MVIHVTLVTMLLYAVLLGVQFNWAVGALYGLQVSRCLFCKLFVSCILEIKVVFDGTV